MAAVPYSRDLSEDDKRILAEKRQVVIKIMTDGRDMHIEKAKEEETRSGQKEFGARFRRLFRIR